MTLWTLALNLEHVTILNEAFAWLRRIMAAHNDSAKLVHADLSNADLRGAVLERVHLNRSRRRAARRTKRSW